MARKEPRIVPQLRLAWEYPRYIEFVAVHRQILEQMRALARWDEKLQALIDSEGRALGISLEDAHAWDDLYVSIARPINASFWWGWESCWRLQELHGKWVQTRKTRRLKTDTQRQIPHAVLTNLKRHVEGEKDPWEAITNLLFEQQNGSSEAEESFWTLPPVESIGSKSSGLGPEE